MRSLAFTLCFIFNIGISISQTVFCEDSVYQTHHVGFRFSYSFLDVTKHLVENPYRVVTIRLEPYYYYTLKKGLGIGLYGEVDFVFSSEYASNYIDLPKFMYGFGPFVRYDYMYKYKLFSFFSEFALSAVNYNNSHKNQFIYDESNLPRFGLFRFRPLGVGLSISKHLNCDISFLVYKWIEGRYRLGMNVGISF
jgi:hypothetical protein